MSEVKLINTKTVPGGIEFEFMIPDNMDQAEVDKQKDQLIKDHILMKAQEKFIKAAILNTMESIAEETGEVE